MHPFSNVNFSVADLLHVSITDCITTIVLCTWVAYHPNVPNPEDGPWMNRFKRIVRAIAGLLSPEGVLMSALSDRVFSRRALLKLKKNRMAPGWTQTHASFAYMGGFRLKNRDSTGKEEGEPLYKEAFFNRVLNGEIEMPIITEEEIQDKSKTDSFGKLIVVIHTIWFVIKFVASPIKPEGSGGGIKYTTLPLGFVTLSLVLVNIFCYVCWWNKPATVNVPIPVFKKAQDNRKSGVSSKEQESNEQSPGKGFWSIVKTACQKAVLLLLLTASGVILSGVNLMAVPFSPGHGKASSWDTPWFVASVVICIGSFILLFAFFSIVVFRNPSELSNGSPFWKFVFAMSIIVSQARACLIGLAVLTLLERPQNGASLQ